VLQSAWQYDGSVVKRQLVVACLISALGAVAQPATAVKNRAPLQASAFYPLPVGSVKPQGWLRGQLLLQANGLTGHLDEFWPDLMPSSAWRGGSGEGWERGPYYLDGLVPLAYVLDDPNLIAKAKPWIEWVLTHQRADGSIGPEKNRDWWPNMIMLKVLTAYQEATGDPRVIPFMEKYFAHQLREMPNRRLYEWAIYRWQDEVLSVLWLYNRTGNPELLALARELRRQGHDWMGQFTNFVFTRRLTRPETSLATHGVNNAMALKAPAVWWLVSGAQADREGVSRMLSLLDRYHGQPQGMFSSDEHYAGLDPSQGIELCAVVEAMFSLEHAAAILGDVTLADRLEKITYNALPATISADFWSHQYDQQPNQVLCSLSRRNWATNGPESNIFGLEPNFGCCTANMHQGWPKFAASLWMATPDDGLAAIAYGPSEVKTTVRGVAVRVVEETDYPFRDTIRITVEPAQPVEFPIRLRIPHWAEGATVGGAAAKPGTYHTLTRQWRSSDRVEIKLPMRTQTMKGFNDGVSVERGPLVYALPVGESWRKLKEFGPSKDWELFPTTPWNYALSLTAPFEFEERAMNPQQPFDPQKAPVALKVKGRRLAEWQMMNDSAGPLPASPVTSKSPEETLTLIPYGAARLRVTVFPVLSTKQ